MTGSPRLDPEERIARQMRPRILEFWVSRGRPQVLEVVLVPPRAIFERTSQFSGALGYPATLTRESRRSVIVTFPSHQPELPFVTADPQHPAADCPKEPATMADAADHTTEMDERLQRRRPSKGHGHKNVLTLPQQFHIQGILQTCLVCVDSTPSARIYEYQGEHSDETVAASMPFPCTAPNVAHVRKELFGQLRQKAPPTLVTVTQEKLDGISFLLLQNRDRILAVETAVCMLIDQLSHNEPLSATALASIRADISRHL